MITPVNRHIIIEPLTHESFVASQKDTYEEIGTIVAVAADIEDEDHCLPVVGEKAYFDAWLAVKYPHKEKGPDAFVWMVKWDDVRAVEGASSQN